MTFDFDKPKEIEVGDHVFNIDIFDLKKENLMSYKSMLVEARRWQRIVEGHGRLLKSKAYLEILDNKKDLPEWKVRLLFEQSKEFAEHQDELNAVCYAVEVLEIAVSSLS
jgi:hypothetical protein